MPATDLLKGTLEAGPSILGATRERPEAGGWAGGVPARRGDTAKLSTGAGEA